MKYAFGIWDCTVRSCCWSIVNTHVYLVLGPNRVMEGVNIILSFVITFYAKNKLKANLTKSKTKTSKFLR